MFGTGETVRPSGSGYRRAFALLLLLHRMEPRETGISPYHLLAAPPNLYFSEAPAQDGSRKYRFGGAANKW
eukprot:5936790-Prymnesium_polylepis.3